MYTLDLSSDAKLYDLTHGLTPQGFVGEVYDANSLVCCTLPSASYANARLQAHRLVVDLHNQASAEHAKRFNLQ